MGANFGLGNLYITDYGNSVIRKINTSGIISTVVGNGTAGWSGDGGQATASEVYYPQGIAFDGSGNLYIGDSGNNRIRKVNTSGIISTFAGTGIQGFSGDGGQATAAQLYGFYGVTLDVSGNLYIADYGNERIRMINTSGIINTFAGNGSFGFSGDGGQATAAKLNGPIGIAFHTSGNLYISDYNNFRIRKITIPCPANAGTNVTTAVCTGTASVTNMSYSWSPATALSCSNCAQPTISYSAMSAPQIYTLTVSGTGCTISTSTVSVAYPTLTASITNITANTGSFTGTGTYTSNITPTYYYWSLTQCTSGGTPIAGGYSATCGYVAGAPSGPNIFTASLPCGTYYIPWFWTGNSCAGDWVTAPIVQTTLTANAGSNQTNYQDNCGHWLPGVTIGTTGVAGVSYTWSPSTNLSPTNTATSTSTYSTTMSSQTKTYTLTASSSGCTSVTSTVNVTAVKNCCVVVCETEGINQVTVNSEHLLVYPNPANEELTIALYDKTDYIQLIDMQGRLVFEVKDIAAGDLKLDISKYNSGIYFIRAKIGDTIEKKKLMVE